MVRPPPSKQTALAPTSGVGGSARKRPDSVALELHPVPFRLAWVLVITAHTLCGMFLLISAATYYYYLTDPIMGYYVHLWAPTTGNQHYGLYALVFACIYCLHLSRTLKLIYCSIRECQLAYKRREKLTMHTSRL
ncbi:hypothetical protein PF005_g28518 [Phytophthora fragariae]|uniref:Uncharacterized protein n=1 Tax=Phytophthora fragariae TaxID=53985 RepID=A0A6A3Q4C7_9STRA|nr:hypothetical protein PF003_g18630 [Phytophthora fragariae]KAE8921260.1 hypothetical protein PF009_g28458 [Phytophthora fragariae]KAE8968606.1 hypothetical protein PF011_g27117 [Phytophthora fragariae]KAE9065973.1 hypothetical protein PF010_g27994 [Phytophthora fragariae]KAE9066525.1 hypothetical protein PF007_g28418 [Phytophthora fragariae]